MSSSPHRNSDSLVIAVASDLHAYKTDPSGTTPSHLRIDIPENQPGVHPIAGLIELIKKENLGADLFLCPGDMGNKAEAVGIQYAWRKVHEVGRKLGASLITSSSGNHDLDSRYINSADADAKGTLLGLSPPYPLPDDKDNNKYWAKNYVIVEREKYRLVILNSCAYHGGKPDEIDHGRIANSTLEFLKREIEKLPEKPINLLLCHHHPQQHMEINLGDYDVMKNGQLLLDMLTKSENGRWLVIHGHKHHPKITYAQGGATSPIVFSAGSLCANLYAELQTRARNQFYMLSLPYDEINRLGLVGTIRAWDWAYGDGWAPASQINSGLPAVSSFGHRADPVQLANRVSDLMTADKMHWESIELNIPEIKYMFREDFASLRQLLNTRHGLEVVEKNGEIVEVGKIL